MAKVIGFIQARLTSTRLPNKVLKRIGEYCVIDLMYKRLKKSTRVDSFVFLIPDSRSNDPLHAYLVESQMPVFRGSEHDVLSRFKDASEVYPADYYLRLTADCPYACSKIIDTVVENALESKSDYFSNIHPSSFADGLDVEFFSREVLNWCASHIKDLHLREHVTLGLYNAPSGSHNFRYEYLANPNGDRSSARLTLDTQEDLEALSAIADVLKKSILEATGAEIENIYESKNLKEINGSLIRNEGVELSKKKYQ